MSSIGASETLRQFAWLVDRLREHRIVRSGDLHASFRVAGDTRAAAASFAHHDPDEDLLRSYLLDLRKVVSEGEPVFINRAFNVGRRHITSERLVHGIDAGRRMWKEQQEQLPLQMKINGQVLTPAEVMDLWVNGHYFHMDAAKRAKLEALSQVPLSRYHFLSAVVSTSNVAFALGNTFVIALRDGLVSEQPVR